MKIKALQVLDAGVDIGVRGRLRATCIATGPEATHRITPDLRGYRVTTLKPPIRTFTLHPSQVVVEWEGEDEEEADAGAPAPAPAAVARRGRPPKDPPTV